MSLFYLWLLLKVELDIITITTIVASFIRLCFLQDALLDIISTNCDKAVRLPDTEVKLPQKCSLRNPHSAEIAKDGSPQAKKKRILSDVSVKVNCSNTESTSGKFSHLFFLKIVIWLEKE